MKSSIHSISSTSTSSFTKPYFTTNKTSQDLTSTRPNSESSSENNSTQFQSFSQNINGKYSAPNFTPIPLGQHNFNIPTETLTNNGFKKRTLITNDSRMDHPFRYTSPVDNCLAQVESPALSTQMEETVKSSQQLSKNIVASTLQAVDDAQLVVGGKNIQVELELSGLKLYDLEQKLDSCLSSSRDILNLNSRLSPKVSKILRLSDKKREISPIRPEFDKISLGSQKVSPFITIAEKAGLKETTSSVSKEEQEKIMRLENERNNLKAIIKETTSKMITVGQKSAGKENMNMATTTPTKTGNVSASKSKTLGQSIERLYENSSPLHPAKTTYNDSPLSKPFQTIPVESPYGLTKKNILKDNESIKVQRPNLEDIEIEEPKEEEEEVISPNFKTSCEEGTSQVKANLNKFVNICENHFEFPKKPVGNGNNKDCSDTFDNTELHVSHPKTEKKSLTKTSKGDWSFNTGYDSSDEGENEHREISNPILAASAKVKPLPPLEKLTTEKKPYLLELQIPLDSDQLRGDRDLDKLEGVELRGTGNNNQAIKQEILGFLKNFQRGETRESAKQWLKTLIDTENLSKASSPTSRTEREKFEEAGESLIKTIMNQTQSNLLKQTVKPISHRTTDGSTSASLKFTADNSMNDCELLISSHRDSKTINSQNKVSPRRTPTPRLDQNNNGENKVIKLQKVPALVPKIQGDLNNGGHGGKRLTPRISPRGENTTVKAPPTLSRAGGQVGQGGKISFAQNLEHLESLRKTVEKSINYIDKSLEDFSERKSIVQETSPRNNTSNSFIKKTIQNTVLKEQKNQSNYEKSLNESQRRCQTESSAYSSATKEKEKTINTKYFVLTKTKTRNNPASNNTAMMSNTMKNNFQRKW